MPVTKQCMGTALWKNQKRDWKTTRNGIAWCSLRKMDRKHMVPMATTSFLENDLISTKNEYDVFVKGKGQEHHAIPLFFFLINLGIRVSLYTPQLISQALKLTTTSISNYFKKIQTHNY